MRLTRFVRNRATRARGNAATLVIHDETTTAPTLSASDRFLADASVYGIDPSDARRVADAAGDAAARYGCSHRMLLDIAAVHLVADRTLDDVLTLVEENASVSYAAVSRWSP